MEYQSEHNIAAVLETLEELEVRESTAVVVTADHGESWGERFNDKSEVRGVYHMHGAGLWDEVLQVPLILAAPELSPAVVPWQVRTVDIALTLLDMAGVAPPAAVDGKSLLPLVEGHPVREALDYLAGRGVACDPPLPSATDARVHICHPPARPWTMTR